MKTYMAFCILLLSLAFNVSGQTEKNPANWKPWFLSSTKQFRLAAPASYKSEVAQVIESQKNIDAAARQQIEFWNAADPGYRWREILNKLWPTDTSSNGPLANMLLNVALYDAMLAAWDSKYAHNRPRPYAADPRIKAMVLKTESPSYPCEHSVAAGVAVTIISKFYPQLKDSVNRMAQRALYSRSQAGMAFPSDIKAGFDLGKKIAEQELVYVKDFGPTNLWDGKVPVGPDKWRGRFALLPNLGKNKTVVLSSGSEYRPAPPPDYANEMTELKNFKQTFASRSNAFYWVSGGFWDEYLDKKIFENNIDVNAPRTARIHATCAVGLYDGLVACWDAKYTYWGIRPNQYDTTFKPLFAAPPFPGYPSGHAVTSGVMSEVLSYFFPEDRALLLSKANEAAESRFQAGIHFRTDNVVGLDMGRKVAGAVLKRTKMDGYDDKANKGRGNSNTISKMKNP